MNQVENVSLKLESEFLRVIEQAMKKHRYMTKAEFIRDALRDKIKKLEKEETLKAIERLHGSSKRKTTDEELHKAGERAFERLEKKFKGAAR